MTVFRILPWMMTRTRALGLCNLAILLMFLVQCPASAFAQEPEPSVTITAPANGEWLLAGTTYTISWTATNVPDDGWFSVSSDSTTPGVHDLPDQCSSLTSDTRTCVWTIDQGALTCPQRLDSGCNPDLIWQWSRIWVDLYDWSGHIASAEARFTVVTRPAAWAGPFLFVTDRATQALWRIDAVTGDKQLITSGGYLQRPGGVGIGGLGPPWRRAWSGFPLLPSDDRNVYIADETGLIRVDSHTGEQVVMDSWPATHVIVDSGGIPFVTWQSGGVGGFPYEWSGQLLAEPRGADFKLWNSFEVFVADSAAFGGSGGVIRLDRATGAQDEACSGPPFDTPVAVAFQWWDEGLLVADATALGSGALISCVGGQPQRLWPIDAPSDLAVFGQSAFVVSPRSGNVTRIDLATGNEKVLAHLDQPVGIELAWGTPPISVSMAEVTVVEGDVGVNEATVTVTLSGPSEETMTVDYETLERGAIEGSDYIATRGTLTFSPGVTSMELSIPVIGDHVHEDEESFQVALRNRDLGIDYFIAHVYIVDDDTPTLRIDDASAVEGRSAAVVFPVTLSQILTYDVAVNYAVVSPSPDVPPVKGFLTIPGGAQTATITVPLIDNHLDESDRIFLVGLSNPVGAILEDEIATGTIIDDDAAPRLSIADMTVAEKANNFTLRVTLSEPSGRKVDVAYRTADDSAIAGADYTARSGTISFQPGQTTASIPLRVTDDTLRESNEQFIVTLLPAPTAAIDKSRGVVTILDNDR